MKTFLIVIALCFAIAIGLLLIPIGADLSPTAGLGAHGWTALILGVVLSTVIGGGLMALSFHSAKSGHDDKATIDREEPVVGDDK